MTVYLYGLLRASAASRPPQAAGVDGAPVRFVDEGGVACVLSDLPDGDFQPRRGDLLAHSDVLQEAVASADVLPMRFGTVFASDDELRDAFLRPNLDGLRQMLDGLQGLVEVQVKGEYDQEAVARDLLATDRTLQTLQARCKSRGDVDSKIELGRRFASVLEQARYADGRRIIDALESLAKDVSVGSPSGEYGVVNASFLVPRSETERFETTFAGLKERLADRIALRHLAPLPPYSFVDAGSLVAG